MNHDLRVLQSGMEPEVRTVYEELYSHETRFGRDADLEPPSRTECITQVCVCVRARVVRECVCMCVHAHVYVLGQ
jgi:hypothetical protein